MALQVAKTTFETKPNSDLITVDVYNATVKKEPINSEQVKPKTKDSNDFDFIIKDPTGLYKKDFGINATTLSQALEKISSSVTNPSEFKNALKDGMLDYTLKAVGYEGTRDGLAKTINTKISKKDLLTAMGEQSEYAKAVIGEVEKSIEGKDLKTAQGIAGLISGLSGSDNLLKIVNFGPQAAIVKSYINLAMKIGLPEAVDLLIQSCGNEKEKNTLYLHSVIDAAYNSDLDFIIQQMDNKKIGVGAIVSLMPDIVIVILQNYRYTTEYPTKEEGEKLISVLNRLDAKWMTYNREGIDIIDLNALVNASSDAVRVLSQVESTRLAANLIEVVENTDLVTATFNMRAFIPPVIMNF